MEILTVAKMQPNENLCKYTLPHASAVYVLYIFVLFTTGALAECTVYTSGAGVLINFYKLFTVCMKIELQIGVPAYEC